MRPKPLAGALGFAFAVAVACPVARAYADNPAGVPAGDSAEAEQLFRAARAAFERREFRAAASAFEEAYKHSQRSAVLYNAGIAWQLADDEPRAADAFARAIERGDLEPLPARDAERRLTELSTRVGRVDIKGVRALTVSIAHVKEGHPPLTVYVAPGHHDLSVFGSAGGPRPARGIEVGAGATVTIDLPAPAPPPLATASTPEPPKTKPSALPWIVGGSLVGVSALSAATAAILGSSALSARDDYERSDFTDAGLRATTLERQTAANVMWATATVTAALGVILFFALPSEKRVAGKTTQGVVTF